MIFPGNLHPFERWSRIALGIGMLAAGWLAEASPWVLALRLFAFYPLVTGLWAWCPIYALLRFRTRR